MNQTSICTITLVFHQHERGRDVTEGRQPRMTNPTSVSVIHFAVTHMLVDIARSFYFEKHLLLCNVLAALFDLSGAVVAGRGAHVALPTFIYVSY